ncbi:hypothetical protein B0H16DRAFT_1470224 [Mycena metata]|uniref:Uncharacterized protein n=1 Tax=Mycena metata TaxID=1033252 RepID=A0AAD7HWQ8_9AGAR|nr:hypothetical protein B0H16DRAFT_1470224 [Mycena metata]
MVITTLASPPSSWQAGFRNISFNASASNIRVSANKQTETNTNCSRVNSFGTTTALVILECPYRWPMSIPGDIHWLRVCVKADYRYGCDNRTDPRYCINITIPGLGLTGLNRKMLSGVEWEGAFIRVRHNGRGGAERDSAWVPVRWVGGELTYNGQRITVGGRFECVLEEAKKPNLGEFKLQIREVIEYRGCSGPDAV